MRHEFIVRFWAQSVRYNETGTGILPELSQDLQYFTPYMFMAHTCKCGVTTKHFSKSWEKLSRSPLVPLLTSQPRNCQAPTIKR